MGSHLIIIKNDENRMLCACSNCKQYIASPSNGNSYDYCYHCGAKFDEHVNARRIKEIKEKAKYDNKVIEEENTEEKKPKLELACYLLPNKEGEEKDYQFGWSKLDNIYDVWNFIGWLINRMEVAITFNHLQYYNDTWDEFKDWIAKVKENGSVVARFSCGKAKYQIEIEEK